MDDFNHQEDNQIIEENVVIKQWFPFSRMGLFYFCIAVGVNVVAVIAAMVLALPMAIKAIVDSGRLTDIVGISQSVSEVITNNMPIIMAIGYALTVPVCMLMLKSIPVDKSAPKKKWKASKLLLCLMISIGDRKSVV